MNPIGRIMNTHVDYEINKGLGEYYLFMGDLEKALTYYNKALAISSERAEAYLGLATVAVQRNELETAAEHYARAAVLAPSDKAYAGLALVEMELGRHDAAFEHFGAALVENPTNMFALNGLVQEAYFRSRLDEALPHLENALTVSDTEALRYALAGCLAALGRDEEAKKQLEFLLGSNPQHANAQELYARVSAA